MNEQVRITARIEPYAADDATRTPERSGSERSAEKRPFVQPVLERHGKLSIVVGTYF